MTYLYVSNFCGKFITKQFVQYKIEMTVITYAYEGFLVLMGALVTSYIIGEVIHLYNEKQTNEAFRTAIDQMTKSTIVTAESLKDTTTLGINSLLNMDTLRDVNSLAQKKAEQNTNSQTSASK